METPDFLWKVVMLVILVGAFFHEAGHIIVGKALGFEFRGLSIGLPFSPKLRVTVIGKEVWITPWLFGAAVLIRGKRNGPLWKKVLFSLSGCTFQIFFALVAVWFFFGEERRLVFTDILRWPWLHDAPRSLSFLIYEDLWRRSVALGLLLNVLEAKLNLIPLIPRSDGWRLALAVVASSYRHLPLPWHWRNAIDDWLEKERREREETIESWLEFKAEIREEIRERLKKLRRRVLKEEKFDEHN